MGIPVLQCAEACSKTDGCAAIQMDCGTNCWLLPACTSPTQSGCGSHSYKVWAKNAAKSEFEVEVAGEKVCTDFAKSADKASSLGSDSCLAQYDGWSEDEYCGQYKYSMCTHATWGEAYSACCPDYCGDYHHRYVDCWWFEQDVGRCHGKEGQLMGTDCLTANDVCCVCRYGKVANFWGKYTNSDGSLVDKWSGQESQSAIRKETSIGSEGEKSEFEIKKETSQIKKETSLASQNARLQKTNRALKEALNTLTN